MRQESDFGRIQRASLLLFFRQLLEFSQERDRHSDKTWCCSDEAFGNTPCG